VAGFMSEVYTGLRENQVKTFHKKEKGASFPTPFLVSHFSERRKRFSSCLKFVRLQLRMIWQSFLQRFYRASLPTSDISDIPASPIETVSGP